MLTFTTYVVSHLKCTYYHCNITALLLQHGKDSNWKKLCTKQQQHLQKNQTNKQTKTHKKPTTNKKTPNKHNKNKVEHCNHCPELPCFKLAWVTGYSQPFLPFLAQEALKQKKTERLIHMGAHLLCS